MFHIVCTIPQSATCCLYFEKLAIVYYKALLIYLSEWVKKSHRLLYHREYANEYIFLRHPTVFYSSTYIIYQYF